MDSFQQFVEKIPETGSLIYGYDCPNTRMVVERVVGQKNVISYGFHQNAKVKATNTCLSKNTSLSEIYFGQRKLGNLKLHIPGYYNVSNALAAISTCLQLGLKFPDMAEILYHFKGVKRRGITFRLNDKFMIMDDYIPSFEIKATLQAIREGGLSTGSLPYFSHILQQN